MKKKESGYVYLLTNPAMPGIVKIGMTHRDQLDSRLRELYTTGVPLPFECVYACKVPHDKCEELEQALHTAFEPNRLNPNREFFRIKPEQAIAIMKFCNVEDATEEVQNEIDNDTDETDKAALRSQKPHRPPLNFSLMGMQIGDKLVWKDDPSIQISVASDRTILYEGREMSISVLTAQLKQSKWKHVAPGRFWLVGDRLLDEIYDETYPMEE